MRIPLVVVPVGILLLPLAWSVAAGLFGGDAQHGRPFLEMPDPRYRQCVRSTAYMRYHHMELLKEIRDEVLREGIRGELGLRKCMECHPRREDFCNRCHDAVSLTPDCFECHDYP